MKIGILIIVFLIVIFAIIRQVRQVMATKRRQVIAIQRKIIEETEDVLKYSTSLSFSKQIEILLLERIITSLKAILKVDPSHHKLKQYISDQHSKKISVKVSTYHNVFIEPNNEREAIDLVRHISALRKMLRQEHAQANISTMDCIAEEQKLERIRVKVRLCNALGRASTFFDEGKFHTAQKALKKVLESIEPLENKDEYIIEGLEQGHTLLRKVNDKLAELATKSEDKNIPEDATSLDILFDIKQC
ncbi:MAG: hypothetical protein ACI9LG_002683 [Moritella dasanensis]|jgi:hypothetical protein